jgi:hypothetical protein
LRRNAAACRSTPTLNRMEAIQVLAPLLGVVIGSVLSGIGAHWRARQERKRIISLALADLLEVRHRLVALNVFVEKVRSLSGVPAEAMPGIRNLFDSLTPVDSGLDARYSQAISHLAGIDPMLAFSLRSKQALPALLTAMRTKAIAGGGDLGLYDSFESQLLRAAKPTLDKAVLELAKAHSLITARKVKRHVAKSEELTADAKHFLMKCRARRRFRGLGSAI